MQRMGVAARRGQMVDKGQVTEDIEVAISAASGSSQVSQVSPSHSSEAPSNGTSIGHCVAQHAIAYIFGSPLISVLVDF